MVSDEYPEGDYDIREEYADMPAWADYEKETYFQESVYDLQQEYIAQGYNEEEAWYLARDAIDYWSHRPEAVHH